MNVPGSLRFARVLAYSTAAHAMMLVAASSFSIPAPTSRALVVESVGFGSPFKGASPARLQRRPTHPPRRAGSAKSPRRAAGVVAPEVSTAAASSPAEGVGAGMAGGGQGPAAGTLVLAPRLLNRAEVLKNCRRYYPDAERRERREGKVVLALHVGTDGRVKGVEVLASAGQGFDAAARKVANSMRFSPGADLRGPVEISVSLPVVFQLYR